MYSRRVETERGFASLASFSETIASYCRKRNEGKANLCRISGISVEVVHLTNVFCRRRTETQQGNSMLHGFVLNVKRPIQSNLYLVLAAIGDLAKPTLLRQGLDLPSRNRLLLKLHPVMGERLATLEIKNKASLQLQGVGPLSNPYTGLPEVGNNRNLPASHRETHGSGHPAHRPGPVETQIRITRNHGRRPVLEVSHGSRAAVWTLKNKTQVSVAYGSYQDLEASLHNLNKFGRQI